MSSLLFLSFASVVIGAPFVAFPINSQVPPIAQAAKRFEFVFSSSTFVSDAQPVKFTLSDGPEWLQLDSGSRKLYGIPSERDSGPFKVKIRAQDASRESIDHEAVFIVSTEPGLKVVRTIDSQLETFGPTDGKRGLVFAPGQRYDFSFAPDTFSPRDRIQRFEAVSSENTPLPSWINFDQGMMKFSGTTPDITSLIAPPQTFDITLVASDYPGFSGASVSFKMVIGAHTLHFKDTYMETNATTGSVFTHKIPLESVLLDGAPISLENLTGVSTNASNWLSFDKNTRVLSGTPPPGTESTTITISAKDAFGGDAEMALNINVKSEVFTFDIPDFNVTSGKDFEHTLNKTQITAAGVRLSAAYEPAVDWVSFDPGELKFSGRAPEDPQSVKIRLSARTSTGDLVDSQSLEMLVTEDDTISISATSITSSAKTLPTSKPTPKGTSSKKTTSAESAENNRKKILIIALATVLPLLVMASFLIIWCCIVRKDNYSSYAGSSIRPMSPVGVDISRPLEPLPQPAGVVAVKKEDTSSPLGRLSSFGYFTADENSGISGGSLASVSSDGDGTVLRLGGPPKAPAPERPPHPPAKKAPVPPEGQDRTSTLAPVNFSKLASARHARPNSQQKYGRLSRKLSDKSMNQRPSSVTSSRRFSLAPGSGKPPYGGPPGYGIPKRSWRKSIMNPGQWEGGGRGLRESDGSFETVSTEIFNQIAQIGQVNHLDHPSIRLVSAGTEVSEEREQSSFGRPKGSSPFFAGSANAWRRLSKMPFGGRTSPREELEDQEVLADDVIRTISREPSQTRTIGTYSSVNLPETPLRRYESACRPGNFGASSSLSNLRQYPTGSTGNEGDSDFSHIVDEGGQRIWRPSQSRESGITALSRGTSSYYQYEPIEFGVAVTSAAAKLEGLRISGRSYENVRDCGASERAGGEGVRPRAKLVDFTKKTAY
ncbi:hypothetical protein L873DRAFT_1308134 [Choiromyces venosus 120613-1]|uniref:Dystroglycan-type cadherin-like domain-containing protein n=1 Tax=Choiromyces venosus 120613-1 TaxID=1336337 RepID=A0A3N4JBD3_9PEZI|nr:hypothetical protein L873DRAFT_1308134 [Choiromyces venosus 120613-1]